MRHYLPELGIPTIIGIEDFSTDCTTAIAGSRRGVRTIKVNNDKAPVPPDMVLGGKRDISAELRQGLLSGSGSLAGFAVPEYVLLRYDGLASAGNSTHLWPPGSGELGLSRMTRSFAQQCTMEDGESGSLAGEFEHLNVRPESSISRCGVCRAYHCGKTGTLYRGSVVVQRTIGPTVQVSVSLVTTGWARGIR